MQGALREQTGNSRHGIQESGREAFLKLALTKAAAFLGGVTFGLSVGCTDSGLGDRALSVVGLRVEGSEGFGVAITFSGPEHSHLTDAFRMRGLQTELTRLKGESPDPS